MRLNNKSYVHKKIRFLCSTLENELDLKLLTDINGELYGLRFESENGLRYMTIDFQNSIIFLLEVNLNAKQRDMVEELLINLTWLYLGEKLSTKRLQNF